MIAVAQTSQAPDEIAAPAPTTPFNQTSAAVWTCVVLAAIVWTPGLLRTYWADEAGTFWMAQHGPAAALAQTLRWPGQSVLYAVLVSLFAHGSTPVREILTRLPSVAGGVVSAWLLYRFAERVAGRGAGVVAAALFITHPSIFRLATSARPYSLALAATIASFYSLYEWLLTRRRVFWTVYVVSSVAVIYLHYLFAFIFAVQILYLLSRRLAERHRDVFPWRDALLATALIAVSAVPLVPLILLLFRNAHSLAYASRPSMNELMIALIPLNTLFAASVAWIVTELWGRSTPGAEQSGFDQIPARKQGLLLMALWWLVGPLFFFALSVMTPLTVFVERYIAFSIPAVCLLMACAAARLLAEPQRWRWMWVTVAILALNPMMLNRFLRPGAEEYGPAIRIVNTLEQQASAPILFRSPLIESNFQNWRAGATPESYLFSPVAAYPLNGPMIPLPNILDDSARSWLNTTMAARLAGTDRILMVARWDEQFVPWMTQYMKGLGYEVHEWKPNYISALEFRRDNQRRGARSERH